MQASAVGGAAGGRGHSMILIFMQASNAYSIMLSVREYSLEFLLLDTYWYLLLIYYYWNLFIFLLISSFAQLLQHRCPGKSPYRSKKMAYRRTLKGVLKGK